jgi:hypothetical protein
MESNESASNGRPDEDLHNVRLLPGRSARDWDQIDGWLVRFAIVGAGLELYCSGSAPVGHWRYRLWALWRSCFLASCGPARSTESRRRAGETRPRSPRATRRGGFHIGQRCR